MSLFVQPLEKFPFTLKLEKKRHNNIAHFPSDGEMPESMARHYYCSQSNDIFRHYSSGKRERDAHSINLTFIFFFFSFWKFLLFLLSCQNHWLETNLVLVAPKFSRHETSSECREYPKPIDEFWSKVDVTDDGESIIRYRLSQAARSARPHWRNKSIGKLSTFFLFLSKTLIVFFFFLFPFNARSPPGSLLPSIRDHDHRIQQGGNDRPNVIHCQPAS